MSDDLLVAQNVYGYDLNRSRIAIVGAGLFGRTLALTLLRRGNSVTLFDKDSIDGRASCAFTGAGMLAPYCELESSSELICELGRDSTKRWSDIVDTLPTKVFQQNAGTIVVAHPSDHLLLTNFYSRISKKLPAICNQMPPQSEQLPAQSDQLPAQSEQLPAQSDQLPAQSDQILMHSSQIVWLDSAQVSELEPSLLGRFDCALFAPDEGQIDNRELMRGLADALLDLNCDWKTNTFVQSISGEEKCELSTSDGTYEFDLVFDCRGLGGKNELPELRGVRGEMLEVEAPDVVLNRPVRFLHPRYPIYIVPRPGKRFLIGATSLECEDYRPISVLSTLELLSAAYSVDPAFAHASIVDTRVNCRPALPNNQPQIQHRNGLIQVNGLYRHGFLLTPKLVTLLIDWLEAKPMKIAFNNLFKEVKQIAFVS